MIKMEKSKTIFLSFFLILLATPQPAVSQEKKILDASNVQSLRNSNTNVYIVTLSPVDSLNQESLHIETLSSILGSTEAAKKALIYSYKLVVHGFAARLTTEQAAELATNKI